MKPEVLGVIHGEFVKFDIRRVPQRSDALRSILDSCGVARDLLGMGCLSCRDGDRCTCQPCAHAMGLR